MTFSTSRLQVNEVLSSKILNMCILYYEYEVQLRKMDVEENFNVKEKLTLK
jgi:hypothetical protein